MSTKKDHFQTEFGDYQTPISLCRQICDLLGRMGIAPDGIIEPTCGLGNFLVSALGQFPSCQVATGIDVNPHYVESARLALEIHGYQNKASVLQGDFFKLDWTALLRSLPGSILVVGNPPWVTNSTLSGMNSSNLPAKSNFQKRSGFDAITGMSNFDVSEWMLIRLLEASFTRHVTIAMLCKVAVARKTLLHFWKNGTHLQHARIFSIDAKSHFNASVEACLFVCQSEPTPRQTSDDTCDIYDGLDLSRYSTTFGLVSGRLVADVERYKKWRHLEGASRLQWRSGIKHDCARVMELSPCLDQDQVYSNGIGAQISLEDDFLYPLLKSSDIANGCITTPSKWVLVTQRSTGENTYPISAVAPRTWAYLNANAPLLDQRRSSIYRGRPRFSVFGIGPYSFALWKVAISSLYKRLHFAAIGPVANKPVMLDDTCYFVACRTQSEANNLADILNSDDAIEFLSCLIFWDNKRPITVHSLERLDLSTLSRELGRGTLFTQSFADPAPYVYVQESLAL